MKESKQIGSWRIFRRAGRLVPRPAVEGEAAQTPVAKQPLVQEPVQRTNQGPILPEKLDLGPIKW